MNSLLRRRRLHLSEAKKSLTLTVLCSVGAFAASSQEALHNPGLPD